MTINKARARVDLGPRPKTDMSHALGGYFAERHSRNPDPPSGRLGRELRDQANFMLDGSWPRPYTRVELAPLSTRTRNA